MAKVELLAPKLIKWEGGLSKDSSDSASYNICTTPFNGQFYHTNKGITYATWVSVFGNNEDKRFFEMSDRDWTHILKLKYWDRWKADTIDNQSVADILVDWVWGSGRYGITIPQQLLGVEADGLVGNKTIQALNNSNQKELFQKIFNARINYLDNICRKRPANKKFYRGWINRLNDFKFKE